jgi:hypothetical protein
MLPSHSLLVSCAKSLAARGLEEHWGDSYLERTFAFVELSHQSHY